MQYSTLTASQWNMFYPKAVLDEVQKKPELIESIKAVYDQYNEPEYLLLGSSQLLLMQKVKETLAGRCRILDVYPLTIPEILSETWEEEPVTSFWQKLLQTWKMPELMNSFRLYPDYAKKDNGFKNGNYRAVLSLNDSQDLTKKFTIK